MKASHTAKQQTVEEKIRFRLKQVIDAVSKKGFCGSPSLLLQGETALHTAVTAASVAIVEFHINCDGALDVVDKQQKDYETGEVDKYPKHLLLGMVNKEMDTALHIAARNGLSEIVKILIHEDVHKKLVRMANKEMDTTLHKVVQNHHANLVKLLTAADPMHEYGANKSGKTPLYLAVEKGYCDVTRLIPATCLCSAHGGPSGRHC
ncbi:hypothetical protein IFM89_013691 [Coptis chinensis]|uniref:Uncharacterized protein n=1 Tax=Coptis chinensis TaxID=261450 RepID=A0A835GXB6_9MAGN|nr:hypothetical protein IFM89_013691 [Coptis chinensis]